MVARVQANILKSIGYLISTVSVILLGVVAWASIGDDKGLRLALVLGVLASIAGMLLRWLSYQVREKEEASSGNTGRARPGAFSRS